MCPCPGLEAVAVDNVDCQWRGSIFRCWLPLDDLYSVSVSTPMDVVTGDIHCSHRWVVPPCSTVFVCWISRSTPVSRCGMVNVCCVLWPLPSSWMDAAMAAMYYQVFCKQQIVWVANVHLVILWSQTFISILIFLCVLHTKWVVCSVVHSASNSA